jgi:short-subunit dehydrogenase
MKAIVTGASGGIGLEFAKLLAADKIDLVLVARSGDKLESIASELRSAHGVHVDTIAIDLSAVDAAARVFERIPDCDILINNAGFASNGAFETLDESVMRSEIMLDVLTLTELTRKYLPKMKARRSGRVLNVASTAAFVPGPFMAVYYACKAYVLSFSQAIAEELRGSGVTVTCLCPGATATGFGERAKMQKTMLFNGPLADAASVARTGYRAMRKGRELVVPGLSNKFIALSPHITPRRLLLWISRRLVE